MASVLVGAKQVLMDVFDADRALEFAEREGATVLHGFEERRQHQRARGPPAPPA